MARRAGRGREPPVLGRALSRASSDIPTTPLAAGAVAGGPRCPACDEPLFVWIETIGFGPREDEIVDRCENCGLVCARDRVPANPQEAVERLFPGQGGGIRGRVPNPASFQAWFGAENWAALRPGSSGLGASPDALRRLFEKTQRRSVKIRPAVASATAAMWQTLINLLTFHRDFALQLASGQLHPSGFKGWSAWVIDLLITVLIAIPTAILAVILELLATAVGRSGVLEVSASAEDS